jgi:hypothetical protein
MRHLRYSNVPKAKEKLVVSRHIQSTSAREPPYGGASEGDRGFLILRPLFVAGSKKQAIR